MCGLRVVCHGVDMTASDLGLQHVFFGFHLLYNALCVHGGYAPLHIE